MEFIISISTKPEFPGVWTSHTPCRNTGPRHHPKLGRGQKGGGEWCHYRGHSREPGSARQRFHQVYGKEVTFKTLRIIQMKTKDLVFWFYRM